MPRNIDASVLEPARSKAYGRALTLGLLIICLGVILVAFRQTIESMALTWASSESYGHGFFIAPLAVVMAWRRRRLLQQSAFAGWPAGGIVAALGCLGWLAGEAAGAMIVKQVSFVLLCQGAVATLIGRHATRILALPLLYLYLMPHWW
jgi:exosortase